MSISATSASGQSEAVQREQLSQMQGGNNWILLKETNEDRFF
jgi:hypothetical protein